METLRTYATGRLPEPARLRLHAVHARDVANRIAGLLWQQRPELGTGVCRRVSGPARRSAPRPGHAVRHDRDLGVDLTALVYDFPYTTSFDRVPADAGIDVAKSTAVSRANCFAERLVSTVRAELTSTGC